MMSKPKTPKISVDAVVEHRGNVILIDRVHAPYGVGFIGGFVDVGETLEEAVRREVLEETGLAVEILGLIGYYDHPGRDQRWEDEQIISMAFACKVSAGIYTEGMLQLVPQNTEVKRVMEVPIADAIQTQLIADHNKMLMDALDGHLDRRRL